MMTAEYNTDNPFAVSVGNASAKKANKISYVLCYQPKLLDWRVSAAKTHQLGVINDALFSQVCDRLDQIVRLK